MVRYCLYILLLTVQIVSAADYFVRTAEKNPDTWSTWLLDGTVWRSNGSGAGLPLLASDSSPGLGLLRYLRGRMQRATAVEDELSITVQNAGYALLDLGNQGNVALSDLSLDPTCVSALYQYDEATKSYLQYRVGASTNSLSLLKPLPFFVLTTKDGCVLSTANPGRSVTVRGGAPGSGTGTAKIDLKPASNEFLGIQKLVSVASNLWRLQADGAEFLATISGGHQDSLVRIETETTPNNWQTLTVFSLSANETRSRLLPIGNNIRALVLSSSGQVLAEERITVSTALQEGLNFLRQYANLLNFTGSFKNASVRANIGSATPVYADAPTDFGLPTLQNIRLTVSGQGITPVSEIYSRDTTAARLQLPLGATARIRLDYLDAFSEIIKSGERVINVEPLMSPVNLEPAPTDLPELLASHSSGYFHDTLTVEFFSPDSQLIYTLDGTDPKSSSQTLSSSGVISLPLTKSTTVLIFNQKDNRRGGTRSFEYRRETTPEVLPIVLNPENLQGEFFHGELDLSFVAPPGRDRLKIRLNNVEHSLPHSIRLNTTTTIQVQTVSEHGFLGAVTTYHYQKVDFSHIQIALAQPSVGFMFAGTGAIEVDFSEPGYQFRYSLLHNQPVTDWITLSLPATIFITDSSSLAGQLLHPSGLASPTLFRQFEKVPLPEPDLISRSFVTVEDEELLVPLSALGNHPDLLLSVVSQPDFGNVHLTSTDLLFVPEPDFHGTDAFVLEYLHSSGLVLELGFLVEVSSHNDVPTYLGATSLVTLEDQSLALDLTVSDVDGDSLQFSTLLQPAHGSLQFSNDQIVYIPNLNYHGIDSFSLGLTDGTTSVPVEFSVDIQPVNDGPEIQLATQQQTEEDTNLTISLLASDVDSDPLQWTVVDIPSHGILSVGTGTALYIPDANYHGGDSFTLSVSDGSDSVTTSLSIIISPVNDAPELQLVGSLNSLEDETAVLTLNLLDVDNTDTHFVTTATVDAGMLFVDDSVLGQVFLRIQPQPNFNGPIQTFLEICDRSDPTMGLCTSLQLALQIAAVNDIPTVQGPFSVSSDEDTAVNFTVSATDSDGDALTLAYVQSQQGSHVLSTSGLDVQVVPALNFSGQDTLMFSLSDGMAPALTFTVDLTLNPVNDSPQILLFQNEGHTIPRTSVTLIEDTSGSIFFRLIDVDGETPVLQTTPIFSQITHVISVAETGPGSGVFTFFPDGRFYHVNGSLSFSVTICDGSTVPPQNLCTTAVFPVEILPENDAPSLSGPFYISVFEDTAKSESLQAYDPESQAIDFTLVTPASSGTATITLTGFLSYLPNLDYFGEDSVLVRVTDPAGGTSVSTVVFTIEPQNDAPMIHWFSDALGTQALTALIANEDSGANAYLYLQDSDGELPVLTPHATISTTAVSLAIISSSDPYRMQFQFTPQADFYGATTVSVSACDASTLPPQAYCTQSTLPLTFTPVNDAPAFVSNYQFSGLEDSLISSMVFAIDIDLDSLSYQVMSTPANGSLTVATNGAFSYNPISNFFGMDSASIGVSDGLTQITTMVSFFVAAQNDAPDIQFFSDSAYSIPVATAFSEDTTATVYFSAFDLDGDIPAIQAPVTVSVTAVDVSLFSSSDVFRSHVVLTPQTHWHGAFTLSVSACDSSTVAPGSLCTTRTIPMQVLPVNDAPTLVEPSQFVSVEDTVFSTQLTHLDIEGDAVSYSLLSSPSSGSVTVLSNGFFTFTPALNQNGLEQFVVTLSDVFAASSSATISLSIIPQNDPPQLLLFSDMSLVTPVTTSDYLEDNSVILFYSLTDPELHPVSLQSAMTSTGFLSAQITTNSATTGQIALTPLTHWFGFSSLSLSACDSSTEPPMNACTTLVLPLNVLPINDAPQLSSFADPGLTAQTQSIVLPEDSSASFYLLTADPDFDLLSLSISAPATVFGTFTLTTSVLTYFPSTNYVGIQTVAVQVCDSSTIVPADLCTTHPLAFHIAGVNDSPLIQFYSDAGRTVLTSGFDLLEDGSQTVYYSVSDPENDLPSVALVNALSASNLFVNTPAMSLSLSVNSDWFGTDSAQIQFCETTPAQPPQLCLTHTLPILVHSVNDAPSLTISTGLPITLFEDTSVSFTVFVTDIDSASLTLTNPVTPAFATVTFPATGTGTITFIPSANANGITTFRISVSDGAISSWLDIPVTVTPVDDSPTLTWPGRSSAVFVNAPYFMEPTALDPDLGSLTFAWAVTTEPLPGTAIISSLSATSPSLTVTYPGIYEVSLTVTDPTSLTTSALYKFVTKDIFETTSTNISLPQTPLALAMSSFANNVVVGWVGASQAGVKILSQDWGTIPGSIATTSSAIQVANRQGDVYVVYRDYAADGNLSVKRSLMGTAPLEYIGVPGFAHITTNAFDIAITAQGIPVVCYAASAFGNRLQCAFHQGQWYRARDFSGLGADPFSGITHLELIQNKENIILLAANATEVKAFSASMTSMGTVYSGSDIQDIDLQNFGDQAIAMIHMLDGTVRVYRHVTGTTWEQLPNPPMSNVRIAALLANGLTPIYLAAGLHNGQMILNHFNNGEWVGNVFSQSNTIGDALAITAKYGQPILAYHQLNSVNPAEVRTLQTRFPMITKVNPPPFSDKFVPNADITLTWNRPLATGSENQIRISTLNTPGVDVPAAYFYESVEDMVRTTVNPTNPLAVDTNYLVKVTTAVADMQGTSVAMDLKFWMRTEPPTVPVSTIPELIALPQHYTLKFKQDLTGTGNYIIPLIQNSPVEIRIVQGSPLWSDWFTGKAPGATNLDFAFWRSQPYTLTTSTGSANLKLYANNPHNISNADVTSFTHDGFAQVVGPAVMEQEESHYIISRKTSSAQIGVWSRNFPGSTFTQLGTDFAFSNNTVAFDIATLDDGKPIIAYADNSTPTNIRVFRYDGSAWPGVAPFPFTVNSGPVTQVVIRTFGRTIYVAADGDTNNLFVARYNLDVGGSWERIDADLAGSNAVNFDMDLVDGIPYIFWVRASPSYQAELRYWKALPNPNQGEWSANILTFAPFNNNVLDGKIEVHRERPYLIVRKQSNQNLEIWRIKPHN